jgi:hypothetical protein
MEARMSGTKRTPISRRHAAPVAPEAAKLFNAMRKLGCECEEIDWDGAYWEREECNGCREWWRLNSLLHAALHLRPWETAVEDPSAGNPYPAGTEAASRWRPNQKAQERWKVLEEAATAA